MSFPLFISRKYLVSKQDSRFINFITVISIIGIALGVSAVVIALSILNGFEKTITSKIVDFDSHIQVLSYRSISPDFRKNSAVIEQLTGSDSANISYFASKKGIIKSRNNVEGVNIKGNSSFISLARNMVDGKHPEASDQVLLGKKLANKLQVWTGDKVTVFALNRDKMPSPENLPNIKSFIVSGIFESGMAEYDDLNIYLSLSSAQALFNIGDNITGYDIRVNNISKIDSLTELLNTKLRYPHFAKSIYQTHRNIFTWLELQKKPIPIVLGLIIVVAVFNIIGTLLMIVLEKTPAIGVLKSLGARNKQVIRIFIYQGVFLSIAGIMLGNLLSFILLFIQLEYNVISLPSSIYFVSNVPVELSAGIFILVSVITFVLALAASIIPSYIASRIRPVSALRFQ
jgi:lipoprotein-releasing system permease protein